MTTTTTRAINRALTYAIESCEGDSGKISAIRKDIDQMLNDDLEETRIIYFLSIVPVRCAQLAHLAKLVNDPSSSGAEALAYGLAIKLQMAQGKCEPIR